MASPEDHPNDQRRVDDLPLKIGLLGCGTVGGATARILLANASELAVKAGAPLTLARVAVRDVSRERAVPLGADVLTADPADVVSDPSIAIVVETIGGIDPARELITAAIKARKHVVTANKELLSQHGAELLDLAADHGVDLLFEAAVGGGIPIIRPLKESLAGDRVIRVMGIVNGTTNFILTRMSEQGESFGEALATAQELGYSELEPSADVDGYDAAAKLSILASLAFNARLTADDVHREGISGVTASDIVAAHELGYEIKLLAVADMEDGQISARVHPAMLPTSHPLASVRDVFNAVFVEAEEAGELMFLGRGAGGAPTGSAVVSDIIEIARNLLSGGRSPVQAVHHREARIRPQAEIPVRYYVVISVLDRPGVLSAVAGIFGGFGISIASLRQEGRGDEASLVLITHLASEGAHRATFEALQRLDVVKDIESTMRVEGTSEG
ncbi:MAG TPA: homoserine dehydrogenase [Actinomycetota bacterium]|nr:homoserine dehydrogenase [Actinomycetota bacterium]